MVEYFLAVTTKQNPSCLLSVCIFVQVILFDQEIMRSCQPIFLKMPAWDDFYGACLALVFKHLPRLLDLPNEDL